MKPSTPASTEVINRETTPQPAIGGLRFDWTMIALSAWLLGGAYVDGWAHAHGKVDNTFFTPWHGLFYSGYLAVALFLMGQAIRNIARGIRWQQSLPVGYGWSLIGALIFWFGGGGDLIWHTLFGIEENVEALLSPTHLLLAIGVWLIVSGPLRADWQRSDHDTQGWAQRLPMILSMTFMLSTVTFMTHIAHPMANLWGSGTTPVTARWLLEEMGVVSFLWDASLLTGSILFLLRRRPLPPGGITILVTLNAIGMGFLLYDSAFPLAHLAGRVLAGVIVDVLYVQLKPSVQRPIALRVFAFAAPAAITALYFATVNVTSGIWWTIHLWAGMIVLSGVVGLLCSYVLAPPPIPVSQD